MQMNNHFRFQQSAFWTQQLNLCYGGSAFFSFQLKIYSWAIIQLNLKIEIPKRFRSAYNSETQDPDATWHREVCGHMDRAAGATIRPTRGEFLLAQLTQSLQKNSRWLQIQGGGDVHGSSIQTLVLSHGAGVQPQQPRKPIALRSFCFFLFSFLNPPSSC